MSNIKPTYIFRCALSRWVPPTNTIFSSNRHKTSQSPKQHRNHQDDAEDSDNDNHTDYPRQGVDGSVKYLIYEEIKKE